MLETCAILPAEAPFWKVRMIRRVCLKVAVASTEQNKHVWRLKATEWYSGVQITRGQGCNGDLSLCLVELLEESMYQAKVYPKRIRQNTATWPWDRVYLQVAPVADRSGDGYIEVVVNPAAGNGEPSCLVSDRKITILQQDLLLANEAVRRRFLTASSNKSANRSARV